MSFLARVHSLQGRGKRTTNLHLHVHVTNSSCNLCGEWMVLDQQTPPASAMNTWLVGNTKPRVVLWRRAQDHRACDSRRSYLSLATWMSDRNMMFKIKRKRNDHLQAGVLPGSDVDYCCPFKLGYPHVAIAVTPSYWRNSSSVVLLTLYGRSRNCLRHCWRQSTPMRQVTSHVAPGESIRRCDVTYLLPPAVSLFPVLLLPVLMCFPFLSLQIESILVWRH